MSNMSTYKKVKSDYNNSLVLKFDLSIGPTVHNSREHLYTGIHINATHYKTGDKISTDLNIFSLSIQWCPLEVYNREALFGCKIKKTSIKMLFIHNRNPISHENTCRAGRVGTFIITREKVSFGLVVLPSLGPGIELMV